MDKKQINDFIFSFGESDFDNAGIKTKQYKINSYLFIKLKPAKKQAKYAIRLLSVLIYFIKLNKESRKNVKAYINP